jgi:hypothetical protein
VRRDGTGANRLAGGGIEQNVRVSHSVRTAVISKEKNARKFDQINGPA